MAKEIAEIPENIKLILEIDMLKWTSEQMTEFSKWQSETDSYPGLMEENRGSQELPCFWQGRGIANKCN